MGMHTRTMRKCRRCKLSFEPDRVHRRICPKCRRVRGRMSINEVQKQLQELKDSNV